jgi:hypothetical protein
MAHQDERAYNGLGSFEKSLCHRNAEDGDVLPANTAFNVHEWIRVKRRSEEMGRRARKHLPLIERGVLRIKFSSRLAAIF